LYFLKEDVLNFAASGNGYVMLQDRFACHWSEQFDFICASSPCEEFSVHGMKCFHPSPPYPTQGIRLFNHTRELCMASGIPFVMENVRAAQQFVGNAVHHCGPFYLWGSGVPPLMPQGIIKGKGFRGAPGAWMEKRPQDISVQDWRNRWQQESERLAGGRANCSGVAATIPPELASCIVDYAEAVCNVETRQLGS
jgi:hypothetical protein